MAGWLSLVETYHRPGMRLDTALEHILVVTLDNDSLGGLDQYGVWRSSFHNGRWLYDRSLPCGGIMTLGCHYSVPGMNA
jgi:hypothetical protein